MNALEGAAVAGELLSWVGLMLGLPLWLTGTVLHSRERALVPTEVVIVRGQHVPQARWFASGDFHERPLHSTEGVYYAGRDYCTGYVNPRRPWLMRFERHRQGTRVCRGLGGAFIVIGLVGFVLSLIPLLLP